MQLKINIVQKVSFCFRLTAIILLTIKPRKTTTALKTTKSQCPNKQNLTLDIKITNKLDTKCHDQKSKTIVLILN